MPAVGQVLVGWVGSVGSAAADSTWVAVALAALAAAAASPTLALVAQAARDAAAAAAGTAANSASAAHDSARNSVTKSPNRVAAAPRGAGLQSDGGALASTPASTLQGGAPAAFHLGGAPGSEGGRARRGWRKARHAAACRQAETKHEWKRYALGVVAHGQDESGTGPAREERGTMNTGECRTVPMLLKESNCQ